MSSETAPPSRLLQQLAVGAVLAILGLHVFLAASGHPAHRDQHLGTALEYAAHGVDLLHPVIVGFNATGTPTLLEVPLWQAATGLALRWGGGWWGWGNIVTWLCFAACIPPFHRLARSTLGARAAWWCVLVFALQPLIVLHGGQAGTDGPALAASIWFAFAAHRMIGTGRWSWWVASALLGALAATQKLPFFMAAGIGTLGLLAASESRRRLIVWFQLVLVGGIAALALLLWQIHAEHQHASAEYPLMDLRFGGGELRAWYFGTWAERFSLLAWARGGYRALTGVFGSFVMLVVAAWSFRDRAQALARWWLAGVAVTTLVFTHLVLAHWHYYLMLCPSCALLCGGALSRLEVWMHARGESSRVGFIATATAALVLASAQGLYTGHFLMRDDYPAEVAQVLAGNTTPTERIVVAGGGWGGEELLLSHRRGLSIWNARQLETRGMIDRLRLLGYTKLALLSQSPRAAAVAVSGGSQQRRILWNDLTAPVVQSWKVVLQTADVCLLELPATAGTSEGRAR